MHIERATVRLTAAIASAAMALIYFLIGLGVLSVGSSTSGESVDMFVFGFSAGIFFLLMAGLLALTDNRWVWYAATILQVLIFATYVATSAIRVPNFEVWGITLRAIQVVLIAGLLYLAWSSPAHEAKEATR